MIQYTQEQPQTKLCTKCGETKPLSEFHRNRSRADGAQVWCKACKIEATHVWQKSNPEQHAERQRVWRQANPEKVARIGARRRAKHPDRVAEQRARHPDRVAARVTIYNAVRRGDFPPAWSMVCDYCQEAQADHWHHHRGYAPEYALDVMAACIACHTAEHRLGRG